MNAQNPDRLAMALALLFGAFYLYLSLLAPPGTRGWDATYHLSLARIYASSGGIPVTTDLIFGGVPIYHPPLFHATMALGGMLLGGLSEVWAENAMKAVTPVFGALTLLLAYRLASEISDRKRALVTLLVVGMFPVYVRFSLISYAELMTTFFSTASVFVVYRAHQRRSLKLLAVSGALSGLACLTKYSGVIPAATSLTFVLFSWKVDGGVDRFRGRVRAALVVVLVVAAVAGPWYARNWLLFGNPIAPFVFGDKFTATGNEVAELTQVKVEKTHAYTPLEVVSLIFQGFWDPPAGSRFYLWYLALGGMLSLPIFIGLVRLVKGRGDSSKLVLIWLFMSGVQLLFYTTGEPIFIRTAMPGIVGVGFIATTGLFEVLRFLETRLVRYSKKSVSVLPLALVFSVALSCLFFNAFEAYRFMREGETTRDYFPVFQWIERDTPQDAVVLTASTWDVVYYAHRRATWFDERIYAPHKPSVLLSQNETEIVQYLTKYQITFLLIKKDDVGKTVNFGGYPEAFVKFAYLSAAFEAVYVDDRVIVFKVNA